MVLRPLLFLTSVLILLFASLSEAEVPEYILGPGDVVEVSVWGHMDLFRTITIRPDGKLSLPLIDEVQAAGLTSRQLDEVITKLLSQHIPEPKVAIIVTEFKSKKAYIVGEVNKPGVYPLFGETTLLEAISMAGGVNKEANLKKGVILRPGGNVLEVNFYKLLVRGDVDQNIILKSGDTIFLPNNEENMVYVLGEVAKPGLYPVGEKLTLLEAVSLAGSVKKNASLKHTKIVRGDLRNPKIFKVNLEWIIRKGEIDKDILLEPGDVVYIPKSGMARFNDVIDSILPTLQAIVFAHRVGNIVSGKE